MDLPKREATFEFEHTGLLTGKKYDGRFTVLCILNMGQRHQLELEKTRLQSDYLNPTDGLTGLALIFSKLRVHIIDAPEWWKQSAGGILIDDEDCLVALYDKILEKEDEWRESLRKDGDSAQQDNKEPEAQTQQETSDTQQNPTPQATSQQ